MFGFGKSARQKRIDALVYENRCLSEALEEAQRKNRELDSLANILRTQRNSYKPDALKFRASRANLKQYQPKPNGTAAAVQGVSSHG
jgi:hypothetical protein